MILKLVFTSYICIKGVNCRTVAMDARNVKTIGGVFRESISNDLECIVWNISILFRRKRYEKLSEKQKTGTHFREISSLASHQIPRKKVPTLCWPAGSPFSKIQNGVWRRVNHRNTKAIYLILMFKFLFISIFSLILQIC